MQRSWVDQRRTCLPTHLLLPCMWLPGTQEFMPVWLLITNHALKCSDLPVGSCS
jgi:hypothetical protein